ncbi:MAG: Rid family detoxifying hydrolase [Erysipelotrichaceae bacterium]|jgi:2-iminobutanoate/2-iminopropanoate deaminase
MNKIIFTEEAPAATGPYQQAIQAGNLLFLSGTLPIDPVTNVLVENNIIAQTEQIMKNIAAVLRKADYTVDDVVKTTCFLSDIANLTEFNTVYGEFFTSNPARSCVAVKDLPKGALVEVEVIASK